MSRELNPVVLLALLVLIGCQRPAPPAEPSQPEPVSPEVAVTEVRQVFQQYVSDWNSENLEGVAAVLAEDMVQMNPEEVITGKATLVEDWKQHLTENVDRWEPEIDEMAAATDLVFMKGHFKETYTPKAGGDETTMLGEGIWVFRREGSGEWRLVLEQWFDRTPKE